MAAGRSGSALAAYARVSAALADDLGTSPTEETEAPHTRILRGQEQPAVPHRPGAALVGREAELEVLERLLGEAGFSRFRRATETPFNRIFEVRP